MITMPLQYSNFLAAASPHLGREYATTLLRLAEEHLATVKHGDLPRWIAALQALPPPTAEFNLDLDCIQIGRPRELAEADRDELYRQLQQFCPWRKGPFNIYGVKIDTEWRSDWKWRRLQHQIAPLAGRTVLDIGCGSGYHCWRSYGAGAELVIGIDPYLLFVLQYWVVKHFLPPLPVFVLPLRFEDMPRAMGCFDTVFSMGVLYHCKEPHQHLRELLAQLRPGGELVLETLIVEDRELLIPAGRYAKMRNVSAIPAVELLPQWLTECGYCNIRTVDVSTTTVEEQRATDWMKFESLADYLSPTDRNLTIEGHPAPRRAVIIANRPLLRHAKR